MKRWLILAVGAMLVLASSRSLADYLVIKIDVTKNYFTAQNPSTKPNSNNSGLEAGGLIKATSPQPGQGFLGGMQPGQGFPGGQGSPGGTQPGQGFPGGGFPGGGFPGGGGLKQGGFPAQPGLGQQGKGGSPMPPGQGKPNFQNKGKPMQEKISPERIQPRWVYAFVELRGKPKTHQDSKKQITHIELDQHSWGRKCIVPLDLIRMPYSDKEVGLIQKDSPAKEYEKRLKNLKDTKDAVQLLRLAEWGLAHGLVKEFHATMAAVNKGEEKTAEVQSILDAYGKIKAELKKTPGGDDPALASLIADLKREGYQPAISEQGHYSLLSNLPRFRQDEINRRLALMEESMEKFYYWFALHAHETLPAVPNRRLLGILVQSANEFRNKHVVWGSLPLVGDGFLPRRDNVMIMSADHLDDDYLMLKRSNLDLTKTVGRDELLSGSVWKRKDLARYGGVVALMQTLILVQKALEDEAERATISHEATRQLLFATGFLPRNVAVPEWIQYGLASFFETPPGAVYPGLGLPSWSNLIDFKYHRAKKKFASPKDALLHVVTDKYFQRAGESDALLAASKERRDSLVSKVQEDREIARSTAWALVYHLAREKKLSYLQRYSQELDRLPRDLELGERVLRGCFERAFDLADMARVQAFSDLWFTEMENNYSLELPDYGREMLKARLEPPTEAAPPPANTKPATVGPRYGG